MRACGLTSEAARRGRVALGLSSLSQLGRSLWTVSPGFLCLGFLSLSFLSLGALACSAEAVDPDRTAAAEEPEGPPVAPIDREPSNVADSEEVDMSSLSPSEPVEPPTDPVALPEGSRELGDVVNFVDESAAEELESFLVESEPQLIFEQRPLNRSLNLFLEHYEEVYDFVVFFTAHPIEGTTSLGKFGAVTRDVMPGTGNETQLAALGYRTNGTVKGVVAMQYISGRFPALAHEILHHYAVNLDEEFGFGVGRNEDHGAHWGYTDVNGQLGGFDLASLRCDEPADAPPGECRRLSNGRVRYRVDTFSPHAGGTSEPMAPFELYLMGLLPIDEVKSEIVVLPEARILDARSEALEGALVVEAEPAQGLPVQTIVARHGEVPLLPTGERQLRVGFVVISAEPVEDDVLAEVNDWAAIFDGRQDHADHASFEEVTRGLATLDGTLAYRRSQSAGVPAIRPAYDCDLLNQDCPIEGSGCYLTGHMEHPKLCALSSGGEMFDECEAITDCAPGLTCALGRRESLCLPFCDHLTTDTVNSCHAMCDDAMVLLQDDEGDVVSARCSF